MLNGFGGFLVSATIVGSGLAGLWAWPTLTDGGLPALVSRATDIYHRVDTRVRPALAALQSPEAGVVDGAPAAAPAVEVTPLQVPAVAPVAGGQCDGGGTNQDTAVIGDRVQLRIFENSVLAAAPVPEGKASATDIVFERLDLSGTYEVNATGAMSLPAIGHVTVAGHTLPCIEVLVARAAFERMRTQNTISATFSTRPPILVRGAVRAPGAHNYSTGLTVERILAQAGALDERDAAGQVRQVALESRRAGLRKTRASLSLERMRVEAALDERDTLPEDDPALQMAATMLGEERVSSERKALAAEIQAARLSRARTDATLADLAIRIETARRQQAAAQTQMDYYAARREQQAQMLQNGFITDSRLDDTAMRAMDAERIFLEKHDLLFRLEAERRLAQQDAELAEAERIKALTAELRRLSAAFDAVENESNTVLAELVLFDDDGLRLAVTINRPTDGDGTHVIAAGADTLVRPGDLVTVSAGGPGDGIDLAGSSPAIIQSAYVK